MFVLRRKRESEFERKSDNNNQIPVPAKVHLHSSMLHSTTNTQENYARSTCPFTLSSLCIHLSLHTPIIVCLFARPMHAYFLSLYLCFLVALAPQMHCILLVHVASTFIYTYMYTKLRVHVPIPITKSAHLTRPPYLSANN